MSSADASSLELFGEPEVRLRFLWKAFLAAAGFVHSGTGYNRSNCRRSRLVYSLPLTRSSDSVSRNLRSLGLEANETTMRSSSLSIHAAACR